MITPQARAAQLASLIASYRFRYSNESELQAGIEKMFRMEHIAFAREFRIGEKDRPDFMVDDVAVEVKVKGSRAVVMTQLHRYAQSQQVSAIVLVTTRVRHLGMPETFNSKPIFVASLLRGAF